MINKIVKEWKEATQEIKEEKELGIFEINTWKKWIDNQKSFHNNLMRFATDEEKDLLSDTTNDLLIALNY